MHSPLVAYYESEASRVEALAADADPSGARECFATVARQYRALAASLDEPEAEVDNGLSLSVVRREV